MNTRAPLVLGLIVAAAIATAFAVGYLTQRPCPCQEAHDLEGAGYGD